MRIAIVINTAWNIYNFRMGLVENLQSNGYEVVAIAPEDDFSEKLREKVSYFSVKMQQKGTNPFYDILLIYKLYRIYKKIDVDCILHYTIKPNIYGTIAASLAGVPCINNVSGLGTVFLHKTPATRIAKMLYKMAFCIPEKVFFQNKEDRMLFVKQGLVKSEITDVLPGSGINLRSFKFVDLPISESFVFLVVARLLYDKGILEYAEAAKILKPKYPNVRFLLAGARDNNPKLGVSKETIDSWMDYKSLEYVGFRTDIKELIANSNCVVLPSYREGTPRSLLEAAAMGRPIVTTNVPGCKEVLVDGYNGFLCQPGNTIDLADKMELVLQLSANELGQMGRNSRQLVEEKFNEQLVFDKYLDAIESVMN